MGGDSDARTVGTEKNITKKAAPIEARRRISRNALQMILGHIFDFDALVLRFRTTLLVTFVFFVFFVLLVLLVFFFEATILSLDPQFYKEEV